MRPHSRRGSPLVITERAFLQKNHHASVDSVLKDLKLSSRRLSTMAAALVDETQILDRLHYKNWNQHRSSLFSRRVSEIRRYLHRAQDSKICNLLDDLRQSFFGQVEGSNLKQMKGSWSYVPDEKYVSHVRRNILSIVMLLKKTHVILCKAFKSLSLAMQTGAFIQLILTLTAITSRLTALVAEMIEVSQLVISVVDRLLVICKASPIEMTGTKPVFTTDLHVSATNSAASVQTKSPPSHDLKPLITVERKILAKQTSNAQNEAGERPRKKKKIRDEIDDIFGF